MAFIQVNKKIPFMLPNGQVSKQNMALKNLFKSMELLQGNRIIDVSAAQFDSNFEQSNNDLARQYFGRNALFKDGPTQSKETRNEPKHEPVAPKEILIDAVNNIISSFGYTHLAPYHANAVIKALNDHIRSGSCSLEDERKIADALLDLRPRGDLTNSIWRKVKMKL